jgi:protein-tyrosine kinase
VIVSFTDTRGSQDSRDLALSIARLWAKQGRRTVLIDAITSDGDSRGFLDARAKRVPVAGLLQKGETAGLSILPVGGAVEDRHLLVTPERIASVLNDLESIADMIVIAAPPVATASDAQLWSAAADRTIIVASRRSSRSTDITAAAEALRSVHAVLLGVVLVDHRRGPDTGKEGATGEADPNECAAVQKEEPKHRATDRLPA